MMSAEVNDQKTKKKKKKKEEDFPKGITEVCLRLPRVSKTRRVLPTNFFWSEDGRRLVEGKKTIYIPCKYSATVLELKERLSGKIKIPPEFLMLIFLGQVLEDEDYLPDQSFEITEDVDDSDDDIFRPRICLNILFRKVIQHENLQEDMHYSNASLELPETAMDGTEATEEPKEIVTESTKSVLSELDGTATLQHTEKNNDEKTSFALSAELALIDCANFASTLESAGYGNEGAFAALTEEDLQASGLWIPRRARVRIMTLAGAVSRRLAVFMQQESGNNYKNIEKDMLGIGVKALTIEGDDKVYATKKELQKAWELKLKDDAREKTPYNREKPKDHSPEIQEALANIRRSCAVDEDGLPIQYTASRPETKYCCKKHEYESAQLCKLFIDQRRLSNAITLETNLRRVGTNGYISRAVLGILIQEALRISFHDSLPEAELNSLLNKCLLTGAELNLKQDWAGEKERRNNLGKLPIPQYDSKRFVQLTVDMIASKDLLKFTNQS